MRQIVIILFLLLFGLPVSSQYRYHYPDAFYFPSLVQSQNGINADKDKSPWLRYSLSSGVIFNSINGFNSAISFISPKAFIPVGSRFVVELGGTFISSPISGSGSEGSMISNSFITYARGIFSLNEKTTVYGEVVKSLPSGMRPGEKGFESYTLGMEYFVTPNFRIGASVTSINGYDPRYLYSPYNSPLRYGNPLFY